MLFLKLRKDETEWCKHLAKKSKRDSMVHVLQVQHLKEQHTKGDEFFVSTLIEVPLFFLLDQPPYSKHLKT